MESLKKTLTCVKTGQDLKSWVSRKRTCRFKSGPGHQVRNITTELPIYSPRMGCLKKSQKEPKSRPSDDTMTPLFWPQFSPKISISKLNTGENCGETIHRH